MIKLTFCLRRRPDLSLEAFQQYWRETHGPLVREHATALRMRRYVQVHRHEVDANDLVRASRGGPEPFDGVAEVWWDSIDDLLAAGSTEEGRTASRLLLEDERRFIDLAHSPLWLGEEHEVWSGP